MARMAQSTGNRVYENFEPTYQWDQDEASKTLILKLHGFKRNQLKVLVMSNHKLRISGERQLDEKNWRRFSKEFTLDSDIDIKEIGAKFEGGNLYVKLPKVNKSQGPTPQVQVPKPQQLSRVEPPSTQKPDQLKDPQEASPPKPKEDKTEAKADEIAQKKKEQNDAKEKNKMEADSKKEAQEKESPNELGQESKTTATQAQEMHETAGRLGQGEARIDQSLPTRVQRLSSTTQQYKAALVGLIMVAKKQSKLTNLIVAILVVLVLGLYVKFATKSYSGGAKTQEL